MRIADVGAGFGGQVLVVITIMKKRVVSSPCGVHLRAKPRQDKDN